MRRRRFLLGLLGGGVAAGAKPLQNDVLVPLWNAFAKVGNEWVERARAGLFDVKRARDMSGKWRKIEGSGLWPKN